MSKKSALTAALSGAPTPAITIPASSGTKGFAGLGSLEAFPCLFHAPDDGTALNTLAEGIDSIDLSKVHVVGSVPTNTLAPNGKQLVGPLLHSSSSRPFFLCLVQANPMHPSCDFYRRLITHWTRIAGVEARRTCLHPIQYRLQLGAWQ